MKLFSQSSNKFRKRALWKTARSLNKPTRQNATAIVMSELLTGDTVGASQYFRRESIFLNLLSLLLFCEAKMLSLILFSLIHTAVFNQFEAIEQVLLNLEKTTGKLLSFEVWSTRSFRTQFHWDKYHWNELLTKSHLVDRRTFIDEEETRSIKSEHYLRNATSKRLRVIKPHFCVQREFCG